MKQYKRIRQNKTVPNKYRENENYWETTRFDDGFGHCIMRYFVRKCFDHSAVMTSLVSETKQNQQ